MTTDALLFAVLALSCISVALVSLTLHKTRRIHLATYELSEQTAVAANEAQVLFAQIQALLALERILSLNRPLPSLRGWTGSPDFLLTVAELLMQRRPSVVLECSSGVSTLVIARCLQLNGSGHVHSLEHDAHYAERTRELLRMHSLEQWATVLHAPLTTRHTETPWYDESVLPDDLGRVDMLVVDGPPASVAPLARLPAMARLEPRMAEVFLVVIDDAGRPAEREMLARWRAAFPAHRQVEVPAEKGCVLVYGTRD